MMDKIEEYKKCNEDVKYFLENYYKCSQNGLYEYIELNDDQKIILHDIENTNVIVREKYKPIGGTTIVIGYLLHYIIFNHSKNIGIFYPSLSHKTSINQQIRTSIDMLPDWLKPKMVNSNKDLIRLENDNVIKFLSMKPHNLRGTTFSLAIFDEPAFGYDFTQDFIDVWIPISSSTNNKSIFISSPSISVSYWDRFVKNYLLRKYNG